MLKDPSQMAMLKPKKKHKYSAQKVEIDGHVFDSKIEAATYVELVVMKGIGFGDSEVFIVKPLPFIFKSGIKYYPDFACFDVDWKGRIVERRYLDCKGVLTPQFKLKMRLMEDEFPNVQVHLVQKSATLADALIKGYLK